MLWTLRRVRRADRRCFRRVGQSDRPEVFPQTVREGGPAEKRTCDDVFAAMQRLVDARDPSYRD